MGRCQMIRGRRRQLYRRGGASWAWRHACGGKYPGPQANRVDNAQAAFLGVMPEAEPVTRLRVVRSNEVSETFKGTINVDIRDSVPDWAPFEPPRAPEGAPSVVYIVLDDVGYSALGCYGGPVQTPNIDRIASRGIRYTQWHTTALCSPTRSCLLTGRNHTRNSMA